MRLIANLAALATVATAALLPIQELDPQLATRELLERDSACTNGPLTRACWANGYSIATDFDKKWPTTGNTVNYHLTITNGTCNPDGHGSRICMLINGAYPGPTITANWGDMVSVTVTNQMQQNGTAIHFHGVRQQNSCGSDGVPGITQCPIAPGQTYTYNFQATQFGTSWYHSHYSTQYGDGVVGPIVFNGPASANYDIDLGPYPINDWYYQTAFQTSAIAAQNALNKQGPPPADNVLVNGTNKISSGAGKYSQTTITSGKKYRLRIINISVDNYLRVSLDNHVMQVMTSDFIPIQPFYTQWLLLAIGQRYDVVINANQTAGNYWFRTSVAADCASANNGAGLAVWSYSGVAAGTPTSTAFASPAPGCVEPVPPPFWVETVPNNGFSNAVETLDLTLTGRQQVPNGPVVSVWALNTTSLSVEWEDPTLQYVMTQNTSYPEELAVYNATSEGDWNYWVIQQSAFVPPIPHPIHIHGHDFFVLGQGSGTFSPTSSNLTFNNPPRRDTASLYGGGWLAFAYKSDNPGAWLLHCHISWHIGQGLGLQFLESPSTVVLPNSNAFNQNCAAWKSYYSTAYWKKDDSGL